MRDVAIYKTQFPLQISLDNPESKKELFLYNQLIGSRGGVGRSRLVYRKVAREPRRASVDVAIDWLNQRYGPGCVTSAAALPAKEYLSHVRIPFGKPSEMR